MKRIAVASLAAAAQLHLIKHGLQSMAFSDSYWFLVAAHYWSLLKHNSSVLLRYCPSLSTFQFLSLLSILANTSGV